MNLATFVTALADVADGFTDVANAFATIAEGSADIAESFTDVVNDFADIANCPAIIKMTITGFVKPFSFNAMIPFKKVIMLADHSWIYEIIQTHHRNFSFGKIG